MRARSTAASVWPGAHEHAAGRAPAAETCGPAARGRAGCVVGSIAAQNGGGAVRRGDAGARRLLGLDRDAERRVEPRGVLRRPSAGCRARRAAPRVIGRQISPRPCLAMKLIASGVTFSRRDRQVALVLPVLVVDDDDHLAARESPRRRLRWRRTETATRRGLAVLRHVAIPAFHVLREPVPDASTRAHDVLAEDVAFEIHRLARPRRRAGSCAPT